MNNYQMYINGEWCDAVSGETYDAIDPALGEPFGKIAKGGREDAQRAIAAANEAAKAWRKVPLWDRCAAATAVAEVIGQRTEDLRDILCTELGK
ncbi:MAG: aldehyde dehydrogenase family protein, partial [Lentisphaeria bacterium]